MKRVHGASLEHRILEDEYIVFPQDKFLNMVWIFVLAGPNVMDKLLVALDHFLATEPMDIEFIGFGCELNPWSATEPMEGHIRFRKLHTG